MSVDPKTYFILVCPDLKCVELISRGETQPPGGGGGSAPVSPGSYAPANPTM